MPDFKTALFNEINALSAAGTLAGTEPIYVATAPNGAKSTTEAVRTLIKTSDPLELTKGISMSIVNPTWGNAANSYTRAFELTVTTDSSITPAGNFSTEGAFTLTHYSTHGQNCYGGGTNGKKTFLPFSVLSTHRGAGQKFCAGLRMLSYSMGDTSTWANNSVNFYGGPIGGDEGQGFALATHLEQGPGRATDVINSVTRSLYSGIITQAVVASQNSQTVTVDNTTNLVNGDWLVVQQQGPSGFPNLEAIQVESFNPGAGTITAKFFNHHPINTTLTPALVLSVASFGVAIGQDRVIVNLSGAVYNTGLCRAGNPTSEPRHKFELSGGGTCSITMVGGDVNNIGAVALVSDDITYVPYHGGNTLRSWHQIGSVFDSTHFFIHSFSVAGDVSYKGYNTGTPVAYEIRPAARVLRNNFSQIICETSAHTWTAGDDIECVMCPYPDVSGFQYNMIVHTPCGEQRGFMSVSNSGAKRFGVAYGVSGGGARYNPGGAAAVAQGADLVAWGSAFSCDFVDVGLNVERCTGAAIRMPFGTGAPYNGKSIIWGNGAAYLTTNGATEGFEWRMLHSGGSHGKLISENLAVGSALLSWDGIFQAIPRTVSLLPAASSTYRGAIACVTDSSVTTWGSTVAAGGSSCVLVFCNGAAWKVMAA